MAEIPVCLVAARPAGQQYENKLAFAARLRDERAFESVDALRTQIAADADRARRELDKP